MPAATDQQPSDVVAAASPSSTSSPKEQPTQAPPRGEGGLKGLTYRERVVRFYEAYAPENLSKVDMALERYRGKEDLLLDDLKLKYGKPEPPLVPAGGDATSPAAAPTSSSGLPPLAATSSSATMAGSPRMGGRDLGSNSSVGMVPSPSQQQHPQQHSFGDTEVSEGDDDVSIPDPYASMRNKVTQDVGFADPALKHLWEDAWLGKIPYGNLKRQWGDTVIHCGLGWKLTNKAAVQRWQRRYFVLVPHFLYYFDSDDAKAPCKGAVYLERATIKETDVKERKSIVITPRVHKKPLELVAEGDFSNFTINFDPKKAQDVWKELLANVAKIAPPLESAAASSSPMVLKSAASTLASHKSMMRRAASSSPAGMQRQPSSLRSPGGGGGGSSLLGIGSPSFGLGEGPLALPPVHDNGSFHTAEQQYATPRATTVSMSQPPLNASMALPPAVAAMEMENEHHQQPRAAPSGGPQHAAEHPHPQHHTHFTPTSSPADDAMLRRALQSSAASVAAATTPEEHKKLMLQQQQLHQMLVAAQQQQNEMIYRTQLQQEVTKAKQTLHVDEADIKRRIARIAAEKSAPQLAEALLSFVMEQVTDLNALWKLMSALDDLPRQQPQQQQQQQQQSWAGAGDIASQIEALQQQQRRLDAVTRLSSSSPSAPPLGTSVADRNHHHHQQQYRSSPPEGRPADASPSTPYGGAPPNAPPSSSPPPPMLSFNDVSARLAAEHQHRRHDDAVQQRQRIQDNYDAATRYHHQQLQHQQYTHNAVAMPPSPFDREKVYSPSPAAGSSSRAHFMGGGGGGGGSDDYAWQDRIARMKQRKRAVEGILNDLPS